MKISTDIEKTVAPANTKMAQMLKLADTDISTTVVKIL